MQKKNIRKNIGTENRLSEHIGTENRLSSSGRNRT